MELINTIKRDLIQYIDMEMERVQIQNILTRLRREMAKGYTSEPAVALETLYVKKLDEICQHKRCVEELIATLDGEELDVMKWRYINGLTWDKVAEAMSYSYTNVHRIHNKALKRLANNIKEVTDNAN